jgi:DNA (cytosine-5)-methyltransferase 1
MKPRLLDLFCGAGGAAMGYHRAGFEVVGVDSIAQRHFPFEFHQDDAFDFPYDGFDVIHASPPCQFYSSTRTMNSCKDRTYPDLIPRTRAHLQAAGKPYIIENVRGSPLMNFAKLNGPMFGLKLHRERWFETSFFFFTPENRKSCGYRIGKDGFVSMVGGGDSGRGRIPKDHRTKAAWQTASGIDWMTMQEMTQAIPPIYTEWIGLQLINQIAPVTNPRLEKNKNINHHG